MDRLGDRAVSPVIGVVLMVAVTTLIAATVGSFFFGLGQETREPAPQVAKSDGAFLVDGGHDQVVRITHRGGDPVTVSNLEIQVSFSEHPEQSRLTGVPTTDIDPVDYEGDDIWDGGATGVRDALASDETEGSDDEWSTGESMTFRIASGDVDVNPGETVTVTVVHEPSGTILFESGFVARTSALDPVSVSAGTEQVFEDAVRGAGSSTVRATGAVDGRRRMAAGDSLAAPSTARAVRSTASKPLR